MMGWGGFCDRFGGFGGGHMWGMGGGGALGFIWPLLGLLFFLGFLALIALAAVWVARRTRATSNVTAGGPGFTGSALDVARRRFAAGEITREEYHQIRDELGES